MPVRTRRWTRLEYERLIDRGVFREDERREGVFTGRSAYFHDPDNNALEVIHLTNNAKG